MAGYNLEQHVADCDRRYGDILKRIGRLEIAMWTTACSAIGMLATLLMHGLH